MMESAYKRGLAVGLPQIASDTIFFRFHDETFEFPAFDLLGAPNIAHYNGIYYEAKVTKLRELKAKSHG